MKPILIPSLFLALLLAAAPAPAAPRDTSIDRPRPLVLANSMGRTNLLLSGMGISIYRLEDLPEGRRVRLSGKVEEMAGSRVFVLRDSTGIVDVIAAERLPPEVKKGFEVRVAGSVRHGIFGTNIKATSVSPLHPDSLLVFDKKPHLPKLASAD